MAGTTSRTKLSIRPRSRSSKQDLMVINAQGTVEIDKLKHADKVVCDLSCVKYKVETLEKAAKQMMLQNTLKSLEQCKRQPHRDRERDDEMRRKAKAEYMRRKRTMETPEQTKERRKRQAELMRQRRAEESSQQCNWQRKIDRENADKRRKKERERARVKRAGETPEQAEKRREYARERARKIRKSEIPDHVEEHRYERKSVRIKQSQEQAQTGKKFSNDNSAPEQTTASEKAQKVNTKCDAIDPLPQASIPGANLACSAKCEEGEPSSYDREQLLQDKLIDNHSARSSVPESKCADKTEREEAGQAIDNIATKQRLGHKLPLPVCVTKRVVKGKMTEPSCTRNEVNSDLWSNRPLFQKIEALKKALNKKIDEAVEERTQAMVAVKQKNRSLVRSQRQQTHIKRITKKDTVLNNNHKKKSEKSIHKQTENLEKPVVQELGKGYVNEVEKMCLEEEELLEEAEPVQGKQSTNPITLEAIVTRRVDSRRLLAIPNLTPIIICPNNMNVHVHAEE